MLFRKSLDLKRVTISNEDLTAIFKLSLFDNGIHTIDQDLSGSIYLLDMVTISDLAVLNDFVISLKDNFPPGTYFGLAKSHIDAEYNTPLFKLKLTKVKETLLSLKNSRPDLEWDGLFFKVS